MIKLNNVGPLSQILLRYKPFYECKQCACAHCNTAAHRLLPVAVQATDVSGPPRAETLLLLLPCSNKCTKTHQWVLMLPWQKIAAASSLSTRNILSANIWDLELICLYRPHPQWLSESWLLIIYQFLDEETQCIGIFELVLFVFLILKMYHWLSSVKYDPCVSGVF